LHQTCRIIPLDLPGHGANSTPAPRPFFEKTLRGVIEQIEREGVGHLVGLSLGASLAIHVALARPELCQSIVLTGYAPAIPAGMNEMMQTQYEMFLHIEENQRQWLRNSKICTEFAGMKRLRRC
jgi:pimeloyl-ACP methyl ester carboxylesterase